jgi:hypothetical protein
MAEVIGFRDRLVEGVPRLPSTTEKPRSTSLHDTGVPGVPSA